MTPPRTVGFTIVSTVFVWAATAVAASVFWPVYQDLSFVIAVGGAILIGTAVAIVGSVFRWPGALVIVVTFLAFVASGVQLAVPSESMTSGLLPTGQGLLDLVTGLGSGWRQLLTITLPVGSYQALLVPAFASVLATTVIALSLALRVRYGELGAIAPTVLFGVGILFGPESVPLALPIALIGLVVVLLWLVWRRTIRRRAAIQVLAAQARDSRGNPMQTRADRGLGARSVVSAGLILAVACVASVGATTGLAPTGSREVLRSVTAQPFDPRNYPSPLSAFRHYLEKGRSDQAMLTVSGLPTGSRIRLATLDSYDGVVFAVGSSDVDSASGTFVRVPTSVEQSHGDGKDVSVEVTVDHYAGVWLPTVGNLESVDFSGGDAAKLRDNFYFNTTSETAAVLGGVSSGDSYRIDAVEPDAISLDALAKSTPGSARVPRLDSLPDAVVQKLESYDAGATTKGSQLVAAVQGLRKQGYISHGLAGEPASLSGHAADRITALLTDTRMIGDAEQYSVAAALMARQLGFPARVVFGFAPTRSGSVTITGADVSAWIEVDTAQFGWVTVDPVPPVRVIPPEQPVQPQQVARPQTPVQPPVQQQQQQNAPAPPDSTKPDDSGPSALLLAILAGLRIAGPIALVLGILSSPLLVVVWLKWRRRRRRRRAATPAKQIKGAWSEFHDVALDHGYEVVGAATRAEFAEVVGLEQSKTLAAVADRAVFAPGAPDRAEADRVWVAMMELNESLGRGLTRWQRFRARVSLRSLARYSERRRLARKRTNR